MKFKNHANKATLQLAIEKGDVEIVQLLVSCLEIDPNIKSISFSFFFYIIVNFNFIKF